MILSSLNYVHILVATLVYFILGAIWYSLLFGKMWAALQGIVMKEEDKKQMPLIFGTTFFLNFIITGAVACVLHYIDPSSVLGAIKVGLLLGVGFTGATTAMNYMYSRRSFKLTVIDSGYHILSICVVSVILTLWP